MWHFEAHICEHPSRDLPHVESHVGMGSLQLERMSFVFGGKKADEDESRVCLPHGQVWMSDGELGHGAGVSDGTWHRLLQR